MKLPYTPQDVKNKTPERFWKKIRFGDPNECWEWQASRFRKLPYGIFAESSKIVKNKKLLAHRHLYRLMFGIENDELKVLHSCDNPPCCNPNHLRLGTSKDNAEDRDSRNRRTPLMGSGHGMSKLTEENVLLIKECLYNGEYHRDLAKKFGVHKSTIGYINSGAIWKHVAFDMGMGTRTGNVSLREDQVREIKNRLRNGDKQRDVARDYNVVQSTIGLIYRGLTWKNVV